MMKYFKKASTRKDGANTRDVGLGFQSDFIVGKFVDIERPTYVEAMNKWYGEVFGEGYEPYEGSIK